MSEKPNDMQIGGKHYKKMVIQHWDYCLLNDIPYMEAQIIKYVGRWRDKGGVSDLEKARHFLDKLIEWEGMSPRDHIAAVQAYMVKQMVDAPAHMADPTARARASADVVDTGLKIDPFAAAHAADATARKG